MKSGTKRIISTLAICGALVLEAGAVAFGSLGKNSVSRADAAGSASVNTVLWGENFAHFGTKTPSSAGTGSGTTIYDDANITYAQSSTNTKGYNENNAGGTAPELLLSKSNQTWTISGIKSGDAKAMSLSFLSNKTSFSLTCSSDAYTVSGSQKSWTLTLGSGKTAPETIDLTLKNTSSKDNARIDDVVLKVTEAGGDVPPTTDYTVSFDLQGHGTAINPQTISAGGKVTRPTDPSEAGWTFGGWYKEQGCTTAYDFNTTVNSTFTLFAKWTQDSPTPVGDADIINFDLTKDKLNGTATSAWVTDFSKTLSSGASVTIHSMGTKGTNNALQWNKNAYLYMTTSGGTLDSVTVKGASKKINIFGSTSAFSGEPTGTATGSVTGSSSGATYTFAESSEFTYLAMHGTDSSTTISEITINYRTAKTLESIEVKTAPLKVDYTAGENFDPTGLVITATYDSGDPEDIAYAGNEGKFTFNPSTNLTQGTTSVQITYGGKSCNQAITVGAAVTLTSIQSITGSLTATIGGSWNTSNLVVTGLMSNSTTKNITSDCNVTVNTPVPSSASTGNASVTATYKTDGTKTLTVTNIPYTVSAEHGTTSSDPLSILEAKAKIDSGISDADKNKTYYILGYYYSTAFAFDPNYNNISYWVTNSSSGSPNEFEFFRINCIEDPGYGSGDAIIVSCKGEKLQKYSSTYEVNTGDFYFTPYDVTFNGNGADETWENPTVSETWMSKYVLPATNPTKEGYDFAGWFTSTTGGTQITTTTVVPKINPGTVYAHWSGKTYAVTLDAKEGTGGSTSVTATYNANMPKITAPSKAGYTFNGYFDAETGGTKYYNTDGSSAHVWDKTSASTLYAQYSANTYTVSFDSQGGSSCSSKSVTYNSSYGELPEPSKTGYTFAGWYTEAEGGSKVVSTDTVLITANQTLYAHWTANTYTVSFDSQGGSACESITVTYNSTYGNLPEPTKSGNAFVGWYTDAEAGTKVLSTDTVLITANQTLYAQWTDAAYRVTFVPGDGATVSPTYKDVIVGEQYGELPEPSKTGHAFDGWYTAAEGGTKVVSTDIVSITSNQTLYAHWTANTSFVTLDPQGGNGGTANVTATYGQEMPSITAPSKDGYNFAGYFDATTGGTKYYGADGSSARTWNKVDANTTLYAQYVAKQFAVTFDSQGGSSVSGITVTYNSSYGTLPTPTYAGYTFAGWYDQATGGTQITKDTVVTITANQTLYAHWDNAEFTVTFDSQGGSTVDNKTVTFGGTYGSLATPTLVGHVFNGWFDQPTGGNEIKADTVVTITANQTLYAQWSAAQYNVSFDSQGGSAESSKVVTYGEAYGELPTPTKTGYTFDGWYTEADGGTKVVATDIVSITADQTLFAHWNANTYTVTFEAGEGASVTPATKSVTYNSTYGELPTPVKVGHTFDGWFTLADGGVEIKSDSVVTITENQTLYAHWSANKYAVTFNGNGAEDYEPVVINETYDANYVLPENDPTLTGYHFLGWFTEPTGGEQVTESNIVKLSAEQTLYAHFEINTYTVALDAEHCTAQEEITSVIHGQPYNNTFTAEEGYYIESITYTMGGGEEVTVQGNSLSIESVTGNLSIKVNVTKIVLDHITVSPTSVEIGYDETVDPSKLTVTAFYNVGKDSANVTDFEITGYDSKTPGTYEATVSYTEDGVTKTTTITVVVVNRVVSIDVTGYDEYVDQGKEYVFNGTVTAHYQDGSTVVNPEGVTVSKVNTENHGPQKATVSFGGVSAQITVNVVQTKIEVEPYLVPAIAGGAVIGLSIVGVALFFFFKKFKI